MLKLSQNQFPVLYDACRIYFVVHNVEKIKQKTVSADSVFVIYPFVSDEILLQIGKMALQFNPFFPTLWCGFGSHRFIFLSN